MANNGTRTIRATTRSMALKARPSPNNVSVTIYEPEDIESSSLSSAPSPANERQRKRMKKEPVFETSPSSTRKLSPRKFDASSPRKVVKPTAKSPKKPKPIPQALASPHPAPENWREVYDTIKKMRSRIAAPVDTMGCDQAQHKESDPKVRSFLRHNRYCEADSTKNRRFATLVSLMLSSQTKDEVTDTAITNLRAAVGGALSIDAIIGADEPTIAEAINKVGFWRRKAG